MALKTFARIIFFCKKYENSKDNGKEIKIVITQYPRELMITIHAAFRPKKLLGSGIGEAKSSKIFAKLSNVKLKPLYVLEPLKAIEIAPKLTKIQVTTNCVTG